MTFKSHTSIFKTRHKIWCLLFDVVLLQLRAENMKIFGESWQRTPWLLRKASSSNIFRCYLSLFQKLENASSELQQHYLDGPSSELKYREAFPLFVPTDINVHELKVKIKGEKPIDLAHIKAARLETLMPLIDFSNKNTIKQDHHHKVSSLVHTESGKESGVTALLVQVSEPGKFNDIDLGANQVVKTNNKFILSFPTTAAQVLPLLPQPIFQVV
ncbi:hypothetical protein EDB83DRAFT_2310275 [Lactarius deliciosus]|nr:hypothetical protein EDB83DRAFT_2310275 [Lactarius deliciosus]